MIKPEYILYHWLIVDSLVTAHIDTEKSKSYSWRNPKVLLNCLGANTILVVTSRKLFTNRSIANVTDDDTYNHSFSPFLRLERCKQQLRTTQRKPVDTLGLIIVGETLTITGASFNTKMRHFLVHSMKLDLHRQRIKTNGKEFCWVCLK